MSNDNNPRYRLEKIIWKDEMSKQETWIIKMQSNDYEVLVSSFLVRGYRIVDLKSNREIIRNV